MILLPILLALSSVEGIQAPDPQEVQVPVAYVFAEPSRTGAVLLKVEKGARLRRVGEENGWTQVELADGRRGWIRSTAFLAREPGDLRAVPGEPAPAVESNHRPSPGAVRAGIAGMLIRGRIDDALRLLRSAREAGVFGPR